MKRLFTSLVFSCFFFFLAQAQPPDTSSKELSPAFQKYLTEHGLWEEWRSNRDRFNCPKSKTFFPSTTYIQPDPHLSLDSLTDDDIRQVIETDAVTPLKSDPNWTSECLRYKGQHYAQQISENPKFFEQNDKNVLSSLVRFPPKLRNRKKIIVTDITASMAPYTEQVLLWHSMTLSKEKGNTYLFFNDGNGTRTKILGRTGGIYSTKPGQAFSSILSVVRKGMMAGDGGDIPENDLEALIEASKLYTGAEELVLIADNRSGIRDINLIQKLADKEIPVRVILCGSKNYDPERYINPDYLSLAFFTKGSIHTLNKDMWDVEERLEGQTIYVGSKRYKIKDGEAIEKAPSADAFGRD